MNISGIRPYMDYSRLSQISSVSTEYDVNTDLIAQHQDETSVSLTQADIDSARANQTYSAYDYAMRYDPLETFEMKGTESDLRSLDVEKAISDMQKDQAIQQYQYFVGDSISQIVSANESSQRMMAEDFTL